MKIFHLKKLSDWSALVKTLTEKLKPGTIITLSGPLGAGKTTFVQYLAKELCIKGSLKSPTFSLLRTYKLSATCPSGRRASYKLRRLLHVDAYRIENENDIIPLNLAEELAQTGTVLVLEWPEHVKTWLARQTSPRITLSIKIRPDDSRTVEITD